MSVTDISQANKQYMTTNQVVKGIQEFLETAQVEEAARLYSHCQEDVGYIMMTRLPKERKLQAALAKMFFMSKDYEKAALVLESNEEYQRAAELYERTDQYDHAAEMFIKIGDNDKAAHNYEKYGSWQTAADLYTQLGNYERAAYCFEKAVNNFLAGKYYYHIKKFQKSMALLQKVSNEDTEYLDAAVMIGNILAMHGYLDIAVAKYKHVTNTVALGPGSVSVYYNLAQLLEKANEIKEALDVYKSVSETDPGYKDVQDRINQLTNDLAKGVQPSASATAQEAEVIEELEPVEEEVMADAGGPSYMQEPKAQIVSVMEGFEFLKNTSLFDGLSLTEMKSLWTICETKVFDPGEILIEQDKPGHALYVIKRGDVVVQKIEGNNTNDLAKLGPGAHLGEMSLIDNAPTSARVVAGQDGVQAFEITRDKFDELLQSDDKIAIKVYKVFISTMAERLRNTTKELAAAKSAK
jgi:tetratricopeptide (TPR) repeat protein